LHSVGVELLSEDGEAVAKDIAEAPVKDLRVVVAGGRMGGVWNGWRVYYGVNVRGEMK
jgi:hypothetical protein